MSLIELETFSKKSIAADRFPSDYHRFRVFRCGDCGIVPFELTIEHHTGSRKGDFKGVIRGRCSECGKEERIFSFTGQHRKPQRENTPVCTCGKRQFFAGECERFEGEDGMLGFFDEGVVVGQCSDCERNLVLVRTD